MKQQTDRRAAKLQAQMDRMVHSPRMVLAVYRELELCGRELARNGITCTISEEVRRALERCGYAVEQEGVGWTVRA